MPAAKPQPFAPSTFDPDQIASLLARAEHTAGDAELQALLALRRPLLELAPEQEPRLRRLLHRYVLGGERAGALRTLQSQLVLARQGQGSLVLIAGAAGIGKTSLALAVTGDARKNGVHVATGRCYERGVTPPFLPWQQVVDALAAAGQLDPAQLPAPFGGGPPVQSADELIAALAAALLGAAAQTPLLLLLEDVHWADQDSLSLLEYLTRTLERVPLLVIATYRSEAAQPGQPLAAELLALQRDRPTAAIHLAALSREDVQRMAEGMLGPCSSQMIRYLYGRSEGHPLFLAEIIRDLERQRVLRQDSAGGWLPPEQAMAVPPLLKQVLLQRISRLGPEAGELLDLAAVAGEVWELGLIETLLGWPEEQLLGVLQQVMGASLIETADALAERYRFTHSLIRQVLYERQIARQLKRRHAAIAALLAQEAARSSPQAAPSDGVAVAAQAYHSYQAGQWQQALDCSLAAGSAAQAAHANHSALQFYYQALDAVNRLPALASSTTRLALYERIGELCIIVGNKQKAVDTFAQMARAAHESGDLSAEVTALSKLANAQHRLPVLTPLADATRQSARELASGLDDPRAEAIVLWAQVTADIASDTLDKLPARLNTLLHMGRSLDDTKLVVGSLRYSAYLAVWEARYAQAVELAGQALKHAQEAGDSLGIVTSGWVLGYAHIERGDYALADHHLQATLKFAHEHGTGQTYIARLQNTIAYLHLECGAVEAAIAYHRRAVAAALEAGQGSAALEAACHGLLDLVSDYVAAGSLDEAHAAWETFESTQAQASYARLRFDSRRPLVQAEMALAIGDFAAALAVAEAAALQAAQHRFQKNIVKAQLYGGQALLGLGQVEEAAKRLRHAVKLSDEIGHAALRWKARLRLAQAHDVLGMQNAALYQEALQQVEQIAANLPRADLHSSFLNSPLVRELKVSAGSPLRATAAPAAASAGPPSGLLTLTRRELDVLRLVAQGITDRAIAEQLHLSVRTVNTHLIHILNKTGCENRAAAAAFAVRHGLV